TLSGFAFAAAMTSANVLNGRSGWVATTLGAVPISSTGSRSFSVARMVQPGLQQRLGTIIVIENKPGASGSIGTAQAAKSPPDGSNWVFVFDTHAVNPFLQNLSIGSTVPPGGNGTTIRVMLPVAGWLRAD